MPDNPADMAARFSAQVLARLNAGALGRPFRFVPSIGSTNQALRQLAASQPAACPHGACLAADYQSAGRGRLNRPWQAQAGSSLLFSLLLRPACALEQAFSFTALASLSLCYALEEKGLSPQIKWPNDVYLNQAKLCGMLSELVPAGTDIGYLVLGMGVNVGQSAAEFADMPRAAVSLRMASGAVWNRATLLADILNHMGRLYAAWQKDEAGWLPAYLSRSWLLGKRVRVQKEGGEAKEGLAVMIKPSGVLLLQLDGGMVLAVNHGDVSVLAIDGRDKAGLRNIS